MLFIKNSLKAPLLEKGYERDLAKNWLNNRDEKSLHKLTQSHMRLVISYAFKYKSYGLSVSDLIQEGCIGLMKAAERFNLDQDVRFSTYAGWWIRAAIQDFILKNWSLVKLASSSRAPEEPTITTLLSVRSEILAEAAVRSVPSKVKLPLSCSSPPAPE